jgi:anti-anti-sigma factor
MDVKRVNDIIIVSVNDRDINTPTIVVKTPSEHAIQTILAEGYRKFIIDLTDVNMMQTKGIRFLLSAFRRVSLQNGRMVLCGLKNQSENLLRTIELLEVFEHRINQKDALEVLNPTAKPEPQPVY